MKKTPHFAVVIFVLACSSWSATYGIFRAFGVSTDSEPDVCTLLSLNRTSELAHWGSMNGTGNCFLPASRVELSCEILFDTMLLANGCRSGRYGSEVGLSSRNSISTVIQALRAPKVKGSMGRERTQHVSINIVVFGGSISYGAGTSQSYSRSLEIALNAVIPVNVRVHNYTTPACGPSVMRTSMMCGFPACASMDLIITEFSINEKSIDELKSWYTFLQQECQIPIIVLNLWSWLEGGPIDIFATQSDYEAPAVKAMESQASFQVLQSPILVDFRAPSMRFWPHTFPFTPSALFNKTEEPVPDECGPHLTPACSMQYANTLQHGNTAFHDLVAASLTYAVRALWTSGLFPRKFLNETQEQGNQGNSSKQLCFGTWGLNLVLLPPDARTYLKQIIDVVHPTSGWHFGEPFAKNKGKVSLFTNSSELAQELVIEIPPSVTNVSLWFVGHSTPDEVVRFEVRKANGHDVVSFNISTSIQGVPGLRIPEKADFSFDTELSAEGGRLLFIKPMEFASPKAVLEIIRVLMSSHV